MTNQLIICKDNFKNEKEFEAMVGQVVMMLLKNRQIMTVRYDEPGLGIVDITYNPDDEAYGCDYPCWLSTDEREYLDTMDS